MYCFSWDFNSFWHTFPEQIPSKSCQFLVLICDYVFLFPSYKDFEKSEILSTAMGKLYSSTIASIGCIFWIFLSWGFNLQVISRGCSRFYGTWSLYSWGKRNFYKKSNIKYCTLKTCCLTMLLLHSSGKASRLFLAQLWELHPLCCPYLLSSTPWQQAMYLTVLLYLNASLLSIL